MDDDPSCADSLTRQYQRTFLQRFEEYMKERRLKEATGGYWWLIDGKRRLGQQEEEEEAAAAAAAAHDKHRQQQHDVRQRDDSENEVVRLAGAAPGSDADGQARAKDEQDDDDEDEEEDEEECKEDEGAHRNSAWSGTQYHGRSVGAGGAYSHAHSGAWSNGAGASSDESSPWSNFQLRAPGGWADYGGTGQIYEDGVNRVDYKHFRPHVETAANFYDDLGGRDDDDGMELRRNEYDTGVPFVHGRPVPEEYESLRDNFGGRDSDDEAAERNTRLQLAQLYANDDAENDYLPFDNIDDDEANVHKDFTGRNSPALYDQQAFDDDDVDSGLGLGMGMGLDLEGVGITGVGLGEPGGGYGRLRSNSPVQDDYGDRAMVQDLMAGLKDTHQRAVRQMDSDRMTQETMDMFRYVWDQVRPQDLVLQHAPKDAEETTSMFPDVPFPKVFVGNVAQDLAVCIYKMNGNMHESHELLKVAHGIYVEYCDPSYDLIEKTAAGMGIVENRIIQDREAKAKNLREARLLKIAALLEALRTMYQANPPASLATAAKEVNAHLETMASELVSAEESALVLHLTPVAEETVGIDDFLHLCHFEEDAQHPGVFVLKQMDGVDPGEALNLATTALSIVNTLSSDPNWDAQDSGWFGEEGNALVQKVMLAERDEGGAQEQEVMPEQEQEQEQEQERQQEDS